MISRLVESPSPRQEVSTPTREFILNLRRVVRKRSSSSRVRRPCRHPLLTPSPVNRLVRAHPRPPFVVHLLRFLFHRYVSEPHRRCGQHSATIAGFGDHHPKRRLQKTSVYLRLLHFDSWLTRRLVFVLRPCLQYSTGILPAGVTKRRGCRVPGAS